MFAFSSDERAFNIESFSHRTIRTTWFLVGLKRKLETCLVVFNKWRLAHYGSEPFIYNLPYHDDDDDDDDDDYDYDDDDDYYYYYYHYHYYYRGIQKRRLFDDAVSATSLFSVDRIDDGYVVFDHIKSLVYGTSILNEEEILAHIHITASSEEVRRTLGLQRVRQPMVRRCTL
ncbi:hypothetical protein ANN_17239 [Periplaneta americana]|uniref:Uncharacterized protein n=1 Tax=Periplaneta americana TaxID=6978 RepID=A0ABQ8STE5_PERAM|nr:hypothetical protein ANN_17239 [Periplaneta americana]